MEREGSAQADAVDWTRDEGMSLMQVGSSNRGVAGGGNPKSGRRQTVAWEAVMTAGTVEAAGAT